MVKEVQLVEHISIITNITRLSSTIQTLSVHGRQLTEQGETIDAQTQQLIRIVNDAETETGKLLRHIQNTEDESYDIKQAQQNINKETQGLNEALTFLNKQMVHSFIFNDLLPAIQKQKLLETHTNDMIDQILLGQVEADDGIKAILETFDKETALDDALNQHKHHSSTINEIYGTMTQKLNNLISEVGQLYSAYEGHKDKKMDHSVGNIVKQYYSLLTLVKRNNDTLTDMDQTVYKLDVSREVYEGAKKDVQKLQQQIADK